MKFTFAIDVVYCPICVKPYKNPPCVFLPIYTLPNLDDVRLIPVSMISPISSLDPQSNEGGIESTIFTLYIKNYVYVSRFVVLVAVWYWFCPHSSWFLDWQWGNRMIAPLPMQWRWRIELSMLQNTICFQDACAKPHIRMDLIMWLYS